jgi:hypothetical protein
MSPSIAPAGPQPITQHLARLNPSVFWVFMA